MDILHIVAVILVAGHGCVYATTTSSGIYTSVVAEEL